MSQLSNVRKIFDFKIGLAGGIVMGLVVFFVNYTYTHEFQGSLTAALKQGVYTFFFGGIIMKICEQIAIRFKNKFSAIVLAVIIPTTIALSLTFGVHSLRGTPRPVASTIPTALFIIPSTAVWAIRKRKKAGL
jgi:hypothetical protein